MINEVHVITWTSSFKVVEKLFTLSSHILLKSCHCQHLAGFFAGLGVHEEVLDEDLWSCGVWCAVLAVVVLFEIVLLCYSLEDSTDLNGLAVCASHTV